jgi:molybdopterin synthase catalytic subunit
MKIKKKHTVLMNGPISSDFVGLSIAKHSSKTEIGAHAIFLGQVRNDTKRNTAVSDIEYSVHNEMAEKIFETIREEAFLKFDMVCMHIYHSTGKVKTGEISLFVFVSCKHREQSFKALEWIVDEIKFKVPIWKKEHYEDGSYTWIGAEKID